MPFNTNRLRRSAIALMAGVTSMLALAGCQAPQPAQDGGGLSIVTTTTQVTDFVEQLVAGTDARVTPLLGPNESVHGFEAKPAALVALAEADVVVQSGAGLETWLDDAIAASGFHGTRIDASTGIELAALHDGHDHGATDDGHDHGAADDDHDHGAADDGHEHGAADDGHDHDHGGVDPHIWTSPKLAEQMVNTIATGLAGADEGHAAQLRDNAAAYVAKLASLDAWIASNIDTVPEGERLIVMNHNALTYFVEAYHVTFVGSIMPSWDDNAEPSVAELDALIAAIRSSGAKAVFSEAQLSPATAEAIASQTGAAVVSGDRALSTDALGEPGSSTGTYIDAMVHNTTVLMTAWGYPVSPVPAELQGA